MPEQTTIYQLQRVETIQPFNGTFTERVAWIFWAEDVAAKA